MKKSLVIIYLLGSGMALFSAVLRAQPDSRKMFGQGAPFKITDLPQQSRLRNTLERLPPKAKQQALKKLHEFSFPENDATVIEVDTNGDIYYIDAEHPPAIAQAEVVSSLPAATATSTALTLPAIDVFKLHSKSGSSKVVYLDFDGHDITGTAWNNTSGVLTYTAKAFDFDFNPSSFSLNERESIHEIWHRIAEDYAPFDIDVTTEQPTHFGPTVGRVLFTSSVDQNGTPMPSSTGGGVAYINAFGLSNYATFYSPAFVYADNLGPNHAPFMAEAGAHEFGHNLGLSHDGVLNQSVNTVCPSTAVYYCGLGNGLVSWAPIMGTSYYANVTQWSKGEYFSANNAQDDLAVIQNKLGYRNDDHGNVIANASPLIVDSTGAISVTTPQNDPSNSLSSNKGIIETSTDVDVYSFDAAAGSVTFTVTPAWTAFTRTGLNYLQYRGANLDIQATLYNAAGVIVANDSITDTKATLSTTLSAAGRYYLSVNSVGNTVTPYSTYNSIGEYFISGTVAPQTSTHVREDHNSDGKADILWRNSNTGINYLYFVNGIIFTDAAINTLSTDWQIKGKGDYNGDGKADILWRNSSTGVSYIHQMNGAAYTQVYLDTVPLVWEVAGSGDFNADGRADILWRNTTTGDNYLYLMNADGSYTASYVNTIANTDWKIKGTGDYNGDGKADVLWRNSTIGVNALFIMNGASVTSIDVINTISDLLWDVKGSGDFNGDGKSDILWRNSSTGSNALFIMNGATASSIDLIDTIADQNWQIKGTGDYNGDGKADILWRNSTSGVNYLYFMNGAVATPAYLNTLAEVNWQPAYVQ